MIRRLGEGGSLLSTGEKQRLLPVQLSQTLPFVLDEATSSIDTETEHLIRMLYIFWKIRTSLSSHTGFPTIRFCRQILVIRDGKILEEGTWSAATGKGHYAKLYMVLYIAQGRDEIRRNI